MEYESKMHPVMREGYAYVPVQKMDKVYSPNNALKAGTIFPELNITIDEYERGLYNGK
ncbi:MAG: spore coat associated protein CotJA [Oscillospiraceae bacterium]|nr:spore coat associated protein CotJA [Oscillospiraceae bacterium]